MVKRGTHPIFAFFGKFGSSLSNSQTHWMNGWLFLVNPMINKTPVVWRPPRLSNVDFEVVALHPHSPGKRTARRT